MEVFVLCIARKLGPILPYMGGKGENKGGKGRERERRKERRSKEREKKREKVTKAPSESAQICRCDGRGVCMLYKKKKKIIIIFSQIFRRFFKID